MGWHCGGALHHFGSRVPVAARRKLTRPGSAVRPLESSDSVPGPPTSSYCSKLPSAPAPCWAPRCAIRWSLASCWLLSCRLPGLTIRQLAQGSRGTIHLDPVRFLSRVSIQYRRPVAASGRVARHPCYAEPGLRARGTGVRHCLQQGRSSMARRFHSEKSAGRLDAAGLRGFCLCSDALITAGAASLPGFSWRWHSF